MFKVEDDDYDKPLDDVLCYAISAKRYVFYQFDEEKQKFKILKYSAHGLGHIENIDEVQWWKDILTAHYFPQKREEILQKYKHKVAVSSYTVNNYNLLTRFDKLNEGKPFSEKIKPFNFFTIGTRYRKDPETGEAVIPCVSKINNNDYDTVQFLPFTDYRTGKLYPNETSLDTQDYWKPLSVVFEEFLEHKEDKSENGIGLLKRRHLMVDNSMIKYIGKETNELEFSNILGTAKPIEYKNDQKRIDRNYYSINRGKSKRDWNFKKRILLS